MFGRKIQIFYCYAPEDKALLEKLEEHLSPLKRSQEIVTWSDCKIQVGMDWEKAIEDHLKLSDVILLLVSPSFLSSDLCYSVQMTKALEKHQKGEAAVIPIILRPILWQETPIGKLKALPRNEKPVTLWRNRDAAFLDIVIDVWLVIKNFIQKACERAEYASLVQKNLSADVYLDKALKERENINAALLRMIEGFSEYELYREWKEKLHYQ